MAAARTIAEFNELERKWEPRRWLINADWSARDPQPEHLRTYTDEQLEAAFGMLTEEQRDVCVMAARIWAQMVREHGHALDPDPMQAAMMMLMMQNEMLLDQWVEEGQFCGTVAKCKFKRAGSFGMGSARSRGVPRRKAKKHAKNARKARRR